MVNSYHNACKCCFAFAGEEEVAMAIQDEKAQQKKATKGRNSKPKPRKRRQKLQPVITHIVPFYNNNVPLVKTSSFAGPTPQPCPCMNK